MWVEMCGWRCVGEYVWVNMCVGVGVDVRYVCGQCVWICVWICDMCVDNVCMWIGVCG